MNKANLKAYAPQARLDFIAAVTARANLLGITAKGASPAEVRGDVAIIEGREWAANIIGQREKLIAKIKARGFEHSIEEAAYTWFNRFAALRYMEIHDYLNHGLRILSSRDGGLPEILGHAHEVALTGLNRERAKELQLAGNRENELYKILLVAQCNELSRTMPFLFERIDDESELLLPENLLRTDSILANFLAEIPEEDWADIEIIGWLYQYYIGAKKAQVMGSIVASNDIPAATQLFTPKWIVKYLVHNNLGRLWLSCNPTSVLAEHWNYCIPPSEQSADVLTQLESLTRVRMQDDGGSLDPESITVIDPACGSGHILVVAYDVLKEIYLERGYQARSIPRLILEKNLFGLDIDDRAAQLAGFALLMKARADDRRLFEQSLELNIFALKESKGLDLQEMAGHLGFFGIAPSNIAELIDTFADAKTIGSLIRIPDSLRGEIPSMEEQLRRAANEGDLYARQAAADLAPLVRQAAVLCRKFDSVIANPPYMGAKYYCQGLSKYINRHFKSAAGDIYACFMFACLDFCKPSGLVTNINIPGWEERRVG